MDKTISKQENKIDNSIDTQIKTLLEYVTPKRKETLYKNLRYRTQYISVLLENIYQPHNASAVLRSCDAFGIQDIHIVEQNNKFKPNQEIAMGSAKWVSIHNYNELNISEVYDQLRKKNYQIVATTVQESSNTLYNFDLTKPSVLVFGNELNGLSQEAIDNADTNLYIPMFGFVESFNISVSVAIILANLINRLHNSNLDWQINKENSQKILLSWLITDVHKSEDILKRANKN